MSSVKVEAEVRTRDRKGGARYIGGNSEPRRPATVRLESTQSGHDWNPLVRVCPPRGEAFYVWYDDLKAALDSVKEAR